MKDNAVDNTISIFEKVFEKYINDEDIRKLNEQLQKLKERREKREND